MKVGSSASRHELSGTASLRIRTAETPADWQIAHRLLDEEHLLGAGREAGDRLCQFILEEDDIIAVLIWCAAAWHLQDRDAMIGWDPVTRSQRLKLVVQLRRFLIVEKTRRRNLASQCLGLALRELPARWHAEHGEEGYEDRGVPKKEAEKRAWVRTNGFRILKLQTTAPWPRISVREFR